MFSPRYRSTLNKLYTPLLEGVLRNNPDEIGLRRLLRHLLEFVDRL